MKNLKLFVLTFAALALSVPSWAQTALTITTFSAAVNGSQTSVNLASATGVVGTSTVLYTEDGTSGVGELMFVNSVSGTTARVTRGYNGSFANPHINGTLVFVGPPAAFPAVEPTGACTATNTLYTPYVNYKTGNQWLCSTITNSWVPGWFNTLGVPGVSAAVASAAAQITPSGPLFHITGTAAITGFTSAVGMGGLATNVTGAPFCVIPDGAFTTTATNNIAFASTAVANKLLCWTFDQTNKKYVASY